jgi:hypothetical protein
MKIEHRSDTPDITLAGRDNPQMRNGTERPRCVICPVHGIAGGVVCR